MEDEPSRQSRVGHLNLKGDYSDLLPAALDEDERGGVLLRIPYLIGNFPERWFWSDLGRYIGGDGKPIPRETPPSELDYFDNKGPVGLVGCRPAGATSMLFGSFSAASGVGALSANYAIENAARAANYAKINGLRSEIDGLAQWLNLWAHRTTMTLPKDGKPINFTTTIDLPSDLRLSSRLNLCATVIGTAPSTQQPEMRYTSTALLQSYSKTKKEWAEHLRLHRAIRDLLRVAIWKPVTFSAHQVTSDKEKIAIREGEDPQSRWCPVKTALTGIDEPVWGKNERPLFVFSDIKSAGIGKWLTLSETNRRGLRPFLRLLDIREGTIDEHMTQLGIAMEALGYQAFRDGGASEKGADKKTMVQRVRKIAGVVSGCVPNIPATFPQDFADGYNAVKHAKRPEPDRTDIFDNYRLGVKILRAWLAVQLGVPEETVLKGMK